MEIKNSYPWGWSKENVKSNAEAMKQAIIAASQQPKSLNPKK
jgi:hypothetical protein